MLSRGKLAALAVLLVVAGVVAVVVVRAARDGDDVDAGAGGYARFGCSVNDLLDDGGGLRELADGAGGPDGSLIAAEAGLLAAAGRLDRDRDDLTAPGEELMAGLQRAQDQGVARAVEAVAAACEDVDRVDTDRDARDDLACAVAVRLADVSPEADGLGARDGAAVWEVRAMEGLAAGGEHAKRAVDVSRGALSLDRDGYADGLAALVADCD